MYFMFFFKYCSLSGKYVLKIKKKRHGCCKIKITDQGPEFVNKVPNKQQHLHVCLYEIVF